MTEFNATWTVGILGSDVHAGVPGVGSCPVASRSPSEKLHFLGEMQIGRAEWTCGGQGCSRRTGCRVRFRSWLFTVLGRGQTGLIGL